MKDCVTDMQSTVKSKMDVLADKYERLKVLEQRRYNYHNENAQVSSRGYFLFPYWYFREKIFAGTSFPDFDEFLQELLGE